MPKITLPPTIQLDIGQLKKSTVWNSRGVDIWDGIENNRGGHRGVRPHRLLAELARKD